MSMAIVSRGYEYESAFVQLVREHAAEQVQRNHRRGVRESDVPKVEGRFCQLEDQPTLPEPEHLITAHGGQISEPVNAVSGIPKAREAH